MILQKAHGCTLFALPDVGRRARGGGGGGDGAGVRGKKRRVCQRCLRETHLLTLSFCALDGSGVLLYYSPVFYVMNAWLRVWHKC